MCGTVLDDGSIVPEVLRETVDIPWRGDLDNGGGGLEARRHSPVATTTDIALSTNAISQHDTALALDEQPGENGGTPRDSGTTAWNAASEFSFITGFANIPGEDGGGGCGEGRRKGNETCSLTLACDSRGGRYEEVSAGYILAPSPLRAVRPLTTAALSVHSARSDHEPPPRSRAKRRYFLVYDEACTDLDSPGVTSLQDDFTGLNECLMALMLLFCAGWVHRDVGSRNVLLWKDSPGALHGKLRDLEFVKRFPLEPELTSHDSGFGSPYFLPVEVGYGQYMEHISNTRKPRRIGSTPESSSGSDEEGGGQSDGSDLENPTQEDPVQHNFAHDLESLWWMAVWAVTCRLGFWNTVYTVFIPHFGVASEARMTFIESPGQLSRCLDALPRSVSRVVGKPLERSRRWFAESYATWTAQGGESRRDPAEYSRGYAALWRLVSQKFEGDVPKLVRMSNPVFKVTTVDYGSDSSVGRTSPDPSR